MPDRPLRPCAYPGCTALVKSGYCPSHAKGRDGHYPDRQRLYNTQRWKRIRAAQLAAHPWCEQGVRQGIYVPATDVHHIERHEGDPQKFFEGKLESLCHQCHSAWRSYEDDRTNTPPPKNFCLGGE